MMLLPALSGSNFIKLILLTRRLFIKGIVVSFFVVAVIVLAGFFFLRNGSTGEADQKTGQEKTDSTNQTTKQQMAGTITYVNGQFSPSSLTIKAGETVTILNKSNDTLDFSSDPHPAHTDNSELNAGIIGPGETRTFTIAKAGSWKFHNHLESTERGEIVVQ